MKFEFSDQRLKNLEIPSSGRIEASDTKRVGLRIRVSSNGSKTFIDERRIKGGGKQKVTIGAYPDPISLSEARRIAREIQAEAARGYSRVEAERADRIEREATKARRMTVAQALEAYSSLHLEKKLRTAEERRRQLRWAFAPYMEMPCEILRRSQLQARVDQKASDGASFAANRIKAAVSAFTKWMWRRDFIPDDVGAGLTKPIDERREVAFRQGGVISRMA